MAARMSIFHAGEVLIQERAHTREDALYLESVGMTQPKLKFGHPEFMADRQEAFIASVDPRDGSVWGSAVFGEPGFVRSRNAGEFEVWGGVLDVDPLRMNAAVENGPLGFLFMDLSSRRRIRSNGVSRPGLVPPGSLSVGVRESFGNCPKYIQRRVPERTTNRNLSAVAVSSTKLSAQQQRMIAQADTMFVASYASRGGADMSHRGGLPGFARVTAPNEIWWPDYSGNGLFNTMGNLAADARCGLLFLDFDGGVSVLQLTGKAEILFAEDLAVSRDRLGLLTPAPEGSTDRAVVFRVEKVLETASAVPARYRMIDYSPANPKLFRTKSVDPQPAGGSKLSNPVKCISIQTVAEGVKEFVFEAPADVGYKPGQYATFSIPDPASVDSGRPQILTRHWTVSSCPGSLPKRSQFSITVKRKDGGAVSTWLHDTFQAGKALNLEGFDGSFVVSPRPCGRQCKILLLSAGIGITPLLSMLRALRHCKESFGLLPVDVVFLHTNRSLKHIPYRDELVASHMERPDLDVTFILTITTHSQESTASIVGRVTEEQLRSLVPDVKERQVYLCGPDQYMNDMTQFLQNLGLPPANLHLETFDF